MVIQCLISLILALTDFYGISNDNISKEQLLHDLATNNIPVTAVDALFTIILIWVLHQNNRLLTKVLEERDPFSNTTLLTVLMAFINLQKFFFKIFLYFKVYATDFDSHTYSPSMLVYQVGRMRYALVAAELLCIVVPMRHNFVIHRLEM
jgi:hypothetical protein